MNKLQKFYGWLGFFVFYGGVLFAIIYDVKQIINIFN